MCKSDSDSKNHWDETWHGFRPFPLGAPCPASHFAPLARAGSASRAVKRLRTNTGIRGDTAIGKPQPLGSGVISHSRNGGQWQCIILIMRYLPSLLPSGKQPHNYGKSPIYSWEDSRNFNDHGFNSELLLITRGHKFHSIPLNPIKPPENPIEPPFSYGFPMVFHQKWQFSMAICRFQLRAPDPDS